MLQQAHVLLHSTTLGLKFTDYANSFTCFSRSQNKIECKSAIQNAPAQKVGTILALEVQICARDRSQTGMRAEPSHNDLG